MKDLRQTYDPNGQKQEKTGNFCKKRAFLEQFTQPALESTHGFLSSCAPPAPKFPAKITGNFSDHIREQQHSLYTEYFYFSTQDKSVFIIDELLEKKGRSNSDSTCSIKCAVAKLVQHTQIASVVLEISCLIASSKFSLL